jgi:hypothetical protein
VSQAAEVIPSMSTAADMEREPSLPAGCAARAADHDNIVCLREASWNVWRWRKGRLIPYALDGEHSVAIDHSRVLPELDLAQLVSFLNQPTAYDATRAYRVALAGG